MTKDHGLIQAQRIILKSLDSILASANHASHVSAAELIIKHWSEVHSTFQGQFIIRVERWRRKHLEIQERWRTAEEGVFGELLRIIRLPGENEPALPGRKKDRAKGTAAPSRQAFAPNGAISDKEVGDFMAMLKEEGISDIFDPANRIIENAVLRPPLILLDGKSIFFDDVWPMYRNRTFNRSWDPNERTPEIALGMDYVLLIIQQEKKWTWPIADRYLIRLPWGHPWKTTVDGRPGWEVSLRILSEIGLISRHHRQTWKLSGISQQKHICDIAQIWIHNG